MKETGWSSSEVHARILKHMYPHRGSVPKWAQLAYDRHWITLAALLVIPLEGDVDIFATLYTDNAMFKLIKKSVLAGCT